MTTINMIIGNENNQSYGIRLVSESLHRITGKGIHNPSFNHKLQIWENGAYGNPETDPHGNPFTEPWSYLWSAVPSVISAHPMKRDILGPTLAVGEEITLKVGGYPLGDFILTAGRWMDPYLVKA